GRQRWRTVRTKQEAIDGREAVRSKIRGGERIAPSKQTFGDYADRWLLNQSHLRASTSALYSTNLKVHLRPRYGRRPLQSNNVDDVETLVSELAAGVRLTVVGGRTERGKGRPLAPNSVRGVLILFGQILDDAVLKGALSANPVRRLQSKHKPTPEPRAFPD